MPKIKIAPSVVAATGSATDEGIPMGEPGRFGFYINRKNVSSNVLKFTYKEAWNEIPTLELDLPNYYGSIDDLAQGNRVVAMYNTKTLGTGILEEPAISNKKGMHQVIRLLGSDGTDLANSIISNLTYVDQDFRTSMKKLCSLNNDGKSPWIIQPDNLDNYGSITMKVDNNYKLNAAIKAVKDTGLWWRITHPAPASGFDWKEEDRFNVYDWSNATLYPEKNNPHFRTFDRSNCSEIKKETGKALNYLRLLGSGNGRNQKEAIVTHATTKRSKLEYGLDTWLLEDVSNSATTIKATNTSGFEATGTIEIDNETITYTGKTVNSFTGCTRGTGGTTAVAHTTDTEIINKSGKLYVLDGSVFDAGGGDVWVGLEKITYTARTNNTLTGLTRGVAWAGTYAPEVKKYYAHGKNAPVWDAQYPATAAGAQSGSSIAQYGLQMALQVDSSIIDQNALDIAAGTIVDLYHTPPIKVHLTSRSNTILNFIELGDTVRVNDPYTAGINNEDLRIYEIKISKKDKGGPITELMVGNEQVTFSKELAQTQQELGNIAVYSQGVPQTITVNEHDDCQGDNTAWDPTSESQEDTDGLFPLKMEFYIPPEAISIDKVYLDYDVSRYRSYSSTTADESAHTHGLSGVTTADDGYTPEVIPMIGGHSSYELDIGTTDTDVALSSIYSYTDSWSSGRCNVHMCSMDPFYSNDIQVILYNDDKSAIVDSDNLVYAGQDEDLKCHLNAVLDFSSSELDQNDIYILQLDADSGYDGYTSFDIVANLVFGYEHTHGFGGGTATAAGSAHHHGINYSISTHATTFNLLKIAIDDGNGYVEKTSDIADDLGLAALSYSSASQIDITKYFGDRPGKKGVKILGCSTDATIRLGRIFGILRCKYFETNRE